MDVRSIAADIDLRLNLLGGDELTTDFLKVKPVTLRDVKRVGYMNYSKYISLVTLEKNEITGGLPEYDDVTLLDIIIYSNNEQLTEAFSQALCFFMNEKVEELLIHEKIGFIFGGKNTERSLEDCQIINNKNFNDFIQIIKYQNCLIGANETYSKPVDDKAKRILEKLKKAKEIVTKVKEKENKGDPSNQIDFADIISAVSTKSNSYNKQNIWDLTIYQLYDEYKRLEMISGYETSLMAMIQGAKIDNLKHWSAKID